MVYPSIRKNRGLNIETMKMSLNIIGVILLLLALAFQIANKKPSITIICLYLYVFVRNVGDLLE